MRLLSRLPVALLLALASASTARAATPPPDTAPAAYQPMHKVTGTVRVWGHGNRNEAYFGKLIPALDAAFSKAQPGAHVESGMLGNASAIGGLYTGAADVAMMDRRISFIELDGFQQVMSHDPVEITVATGSLKTREHAPATAIFVNKQNPVRSLSMAQLDAIFDADHRRGPAGAVTWGDVGATGAWASHPIHPIGFALPRKQAQAFEKSVMKGSQKWVCTLKTFDYDRKDPGGSAAAKAIRAAVAADPDAVAYATMESDTPDTRVLPIAATEGAPVLPTAATLADGSYPLAETISVYVDRSPGQPIEPRSAEFVRFLLSREGQALLSSAGGLTPLSPAALARERSKLQ